MNDLFGPAFLKPRPREGPGRPPPARAFLLSIRLSLLFLLGCRPQAVKDPAEESRTPPASNLFEESAAESGIRFIHDSGAKGDYFMPEHIGSGAALCDFDNDGLLDLYLVQCGGPESASRNQLYRQKPDGSFENVSAGSGADVTGYGMGALAGDVNNDGLADLVVTEYGRVRLFRNLGGNKFRECTPGCGIDNPRWATAASFLDYDRDGFLDLVIANYVDYIPDHECFDAAGAREYCGPQNFQGTVARLLRNRAKPEPEFEDVTVPSGLARATGPALGLYCADFDANGWPDIFIADDGKPNRLFLNQGDGTFREEAALRGLAYNAMGATAGNMGVAVGDVNGDGLFDLFVTHLSHEQHALWIQESRGLFQDRTAEFGLANPAWRGTGFGAVLADFDLDGQLDLAFVNGRIRRGDDPGPRIEGLAPFWSPYAQRAQLFLGTAGSKFRDVSLVNPAFSGHAMVGRALAYGDIDNDGDIDLVATCTGGPVQLFRNVAPRQGRWLTLRLLDPRHGDRDAVGAEVRLDAGGKQRTAQVQPSSSYLCGNDPRIHFGLGAAARVDAIHVRWPDGSIEGFPETPVDRHVVLRKGTGTPRGP